MKRKFFIVSGVIALTAAAVLSGCQQLQQPQVPPEQVVKEGMKKLTSVTSHQFEFGVKGDMTSDQDGKPVKTQFDITLGGSVDMKDTKDPKVNLKLDGSGSQDAMSASGSGEFRMNKDALYFTVAKLDTKGGEPIPKELSTYFGKWWKVTIPPEALQQFTSTLPEGGSQESLTPEQQKMKTLFENTQFFKNIKFVAMEDVKGEQSYHYSAELDKDAVMKFVQAAAEEQGKPMTDADKKDMQDSMQKVDFTGNVWVGATSGILNQVTGDVKVTGATSKDPSGTVSIRVTLWDFNKPVTVQIPSDAQEFPIQELIQGMTGGALPTGADTGLPVTPDLGGATPTGADTGTLPTVPTDTGTGTSTTTTTTTGQ